MHYNIITSSIININYTLTLRMKIIITHFAVIEQRPNENNDYILFAHYISDGART